jgi:hypothetical protein
MNNKIQRKESSELSRTPLSVDWDPYSLILSSTHFERSSSQLECSSPCINFPNSSKCINFPRHWNETQVPTESLGEESQSDTASYLLLPAFLGAGWTRDQESKNKTAGLLTARERKDHLWFLPPPGLEGFGLHREISLLLSQEQVVRSAISRPLVNSPFLLSW